MEVMVIEFFGKMEWRCLARIENCTVQVLRSLSYLVFYLIGLCLAELGVGSKHHGVVRIGYTHSPVNGEGSEYFFIP